MAGQIEIYLHSNATVQSIPDHFGEFYHGLCVMRSEKKAVKRALPIAQGKIVRRAISTEGYSGYENGLDVEIV